MAIRQKHKKHIMQKSFKVQSTKNYDLFKKLPGNRELSQGNLKRIKESMKKQFMPIPILVNDLNQVVDGQHRLQAAKDLGLHVYYMKIPNMGLDEVHTLNSISKSFSFSDYLTGYASAGLVDYQHALEFVRKFPKLPTRACKFLWMGVVTAGGEKDNATALFRGGQMKIKDLKKAVDIASLIYEINDMFPELKIMRTGPIIPIIEMIENKNFDLARFTTKMNQCAGKLLRSGSNSSFDWRLGLNKIYNFNCRGKQPKVNLWTAKQLGME